MVRTAGENRMAAAGEKLYSHVDLVQMLGIVNLEAGSEVRCPVWDFVMFSNTNHACRLGHQMLHACH